MLVIVARLPRNTVVRGVSFQLNIIGTPEFDLRLHVTDHVITLLLCPAIYTFSTILPVNAVLLYCYVLSINQSINQYMNMSRIPSKCTSRQKINFLRQGFRELSYYYTWAYVPTDRLHNTDRCDRKVALRFTGGIIQTTTAAAATTTTVIIRSLFGRR